MRCIRNINCRELNLDEEFIRLNLKGVFLYSIMDNVVKDILDSCYELTSEDVKIIPPKPKDTNAHARGKSTIQCLSDSKGTDGKDRQIHINKTINESTKHCLQEIVKKYDLSLKEEKNKTVIYLPSI